MNNAKLILMIVIALHVIELITVNKILMKIIMDYAFVKKVIMTIIKIINVNNAHNFGYFIIKKYIII